MTYKAIEARLDKIEESAEIRRVEAREDNQIIFKKLAEIKEGQAFFSGKSVGINLVACLIFTVILQVGIAIYNKPVDNMKTIESKNLGR